MFLQVEAHICVAHICVTPYCSICKWHASFMRTCMCLDAWLPKAYNSMLPCTVRWLFGLRCLSPTPLSGPCNLISRWVVSADEPRHQTSVCLMCLVMRQQSVPYFLKAPSQSSRESNQIN